MVKALAQNKYLFSFTLCISFISAASSIGSAFLLQAILDAVTGQNWALFRTLLWVSPLYIGVVTLLALWESVCIKKLVTRTAACMRQSLYRGILSRTTQEFHATNSAGYISAITNDLKTVEAQGLLLLMQTFQFGFVFILSAAALLYYSPLIAGLMLGCLLAMYLVPTALGKPIGRRQALLTGSFSFFTVGLKDKLAGYSVLRSYGLLDRAKQDLDGLNKSLADGQQSLNRFTALAESLSAMLSMGSQILVMLVSGYMVLRGQLTAGALVSLIQLSGSFVQPVAIIMQNTPLIQGVTPVFGRLMALCTPAPSAFTGTATAHIEKEIRFENVSFAYKAEQPVLQNLTMRLETGKKYALVGASGSGKSTVAKLLQGSYEGYTGAITADGRELHELDINGLLAQISAVQQETYLFDDTIRSNIGFYGSFTEAQWQTALQKSGASLFTGELENGLDTPCGENGAALSGGQRQRIALARALLHKRPMLILDEGTSAIDAATAHGIEAGLLTEEGLTLLSITHDTSPALLRGYDTILYMENGRIVQQGSYDSLLAAGGGFAGFVQPKRKEALSL